MADAAARTAVKDLALKNRAFFTRLLVDPRKTLLGVKRRFNLSNRDIDAMAKRIDRWVGSIAGAQWTKWKQAVGRGKEIPPIWP